MDYITIWIYQNWFNLVFNGILQNHHKQSLIQLYKNSDGSAISQYSYTELLEQQYGFTSNIKITWSCYSSELKNSKHKTLSFIILFIYHWRYLWSSNENTRLNAHLF